MRFVFAFICLATPAAAQSTFPVPEGCDAFLTVQNKSCTVDHHFICSADPEGHQRRVGLDEDGLVFAGTIDNEAQWIASFHPFTGHTELLEDDPAERASLSDLIETGVDDYDFRTLSDQIGATRFVGQDTLTGRQVTIDGITLDQTTYDIIAYNEAGDEIWRSKGREFISRDWRMFLSGTGQTTVGGETFDEDDTPVEFIFPGERGFLSSSPKHGCGATISSLDFLKEIPHDNL